MSSELEKLASEVRGLAADSSPLRRSLADHRLASRNLVSRAQAVGRSGSPVAQAVSAAGGDAAKALHELSQFATSASRFADRLVGGGGGGVGGGTAGGGASGADTSARTGDGSVFAADTQWDEQEDVMIGDRRVTRSAKSSTRTDTVGGVSSTVTTDAVTVGANSAMWTSVDGRPATAKGVIREVFSGASRPATESSATRQVGGVGTADDGGHLLGFQFLLSQGLKNLLPQDAHLNRGSYKSMEMAVAQWAKSGHTIHFVVEPAEMDAGGRPTGFDVYLLPHLGGSPVAHPTKATGASGIRVDDHRIYFSNDPSGPASE